MNMILPASVSAMPNGTTSMPNGTTRPQVRIVIVGHVDHGKSTLVGRLLHETGSLPEGKLEMLKAVSARRGMPFEWSFLLDALQTERDQGITIDTSQIRLRTPVTSSRLCGDARRRLRIRGPWSGRSVPGSWLPRARR